MKIPTKPKGKNKYKKNVSDYKTAERILDPYVMGKATASQVQKQLKAQGLGADLRGNSSKIHVWTLDFEKNFEVEM